MLLQTPANFKTEKIKDYNWTQHLSFYALACSTSVSLLYISNLRPFSYTVFKTKSSTLMSPGRESFPPTAAETSGKQQLVLPALFFGLCLVRGAAPLRILQPSEATMFKAVLYTPAQPGALSIMQKVLQYTSLSCHPSHQP